MKVLVVNESFCRKSLEVVNDSEVVKSLMFFCGRKSHEVVKSREEKQRTTKQPISSLYPLLERNRLFLVFKFFW